MTKRNQFGLAPSGFALIVFAIAVVLGLSISGRAQSSSYVIAASNVAVSSSGAAALPATGDEADGNVLTIKKRVDEVNVLFIATDRHGKFVRRSEEHTSELQSLRH